MQRLSTIAAIALLAAAMLVVAVATGDEIVAAQSPAYSHAHVAWPHGKFPVELPE